MAKEIERKFLVKGDSWRGRVEGTSYRQGYLSTVKERVVRVRTVGEKGYITVKGITVNASRLEFEYEIPAQDANDMLDRFCERPLIEKRRYKLESGGFVWEIDEFEGENRGLIVAEVELSDVDQSFDLPEWAGAEVSDDPRYFNSNLIAHPYSAW